MKWSFHLDVFVAQAVTHERFVVLIDFLFIIYGVSVGGLQFWGQIELLDVFLKEPLGLFDAADEHQKA